MIRPHLDYIDFTIDFSSADRIQKLDNLQKKGVRRIEYCLYSENRQNVEVLKENYYIESLRLCRKTNLVKIMYSRILLRPKPPVPDQNTHNKMNEIDQDGSPPPPFVCVWGGGGVLTQGMTSES